MTTVRLWQAWISAGSYPSRFIARMTPSSCHGVVELPGKKKCQEMLTLSAVSASRAIDLLVAGQVHQLVVVGQHRGRAWSGGSRLSNVAWHAVGAYQRRARTESR